MPDSKLQSLFVIPPNENQTTFGVDDKLPSLPLPDIKHTLDRYLDSLKPFISKAEYKERVELVRLFEEGVGKKLHEKLKQKAKKERNWVEKWWEEVAYLQVRAPLLPYCSMDGIFPKNVACLTYGTEEDQIKHAALFAYHIVKFWDLLRKEELRPTQTAHKKINFSMVQYRRLFNTVRIPGEKVDSLATYFKTVSEGSCSTNITVMFKGKLFILNGVDGKGNPISPMQWELGLKKVMEKCISSGHEPALGILTCDTRTNWYRNRKHLEALSDENKQMLETLEKSMFVLVLDDASPETDTQLSNCNLCGDYDNRWSDKSMSMIFYKNGRIGSICDHTAFDGIVAIACHHYVFTAIEESKPECETNEAKEPEIQELKFEIDEELKEEINRLKVETIRNKKEILMTRYIFEDYGKLEIQRLKFHPDSYIQMCLQLAYFTLHRKPGPCYETATTRKFYNGRTETLRCCTTQCLDWVASMLDPKATVSVSVFINTLPAVTAVMMKNEQRKKLLMAAVERHDVLMDEARENAGCDRHLLGLYCTALEEGIEIPNLFLDPAYLKSGGGGNFVLSTSCTGYTPLGGGVAPMCTDGYGIFYNITPNKIYITISVNTFSRETDAERYFMSLKNAFNQTRQMLLSCDATKSKF